MRTSWTLATAVVLLFGSLALAACGGSDDSGAKNGSDKSTLGTASELRATLNILFAEHVALAANATGAALGGRTEEFKAAVEALDGNSVQIAKVFGSPHGAEAETAMLAGWRRHIGFFVDYTLGAAANDSAKKQQAVADLNQYAADVGELMNKTVGLPQDAVAKGVEGHQKSLTAVIDAQAAGDQAKAYVALRESIAHMHTLADPLADATVKKFPDRFAAAPHH